MSEFSTVWYNLFYHKVNIKSDKKRKFIEFVLSKYGNIRYVELNDYQVELVYNLYKFNKLTETDDGLVLNYYGIYYYHREKNKDEAMRYLLLAIEKNNIHAMNNLGVFFYRQRNYDEMKKYYSMAIDNGNTSAMINYGEYYIFGDCWIYPFEKKSEKNYDLAKKYFLMAYDKGDIEGIIQLAFYFSNDCDLANKYYSIAVERGNSKAMVLLADYYDSIRKNTLMKKYYLMAVNAGNDIAMFSLGRFYQYTDINYDLMKKYYLMAIKEGNYDAMQNIADYYINIKNNPKKANKYYSMIRETSETIFGPIDNSRDIIKETSKMFYDNGCYFRNIQNYDEMKRFFLLAIQYGNTTAMYNLAQYYETVEIKPALMRRYYLKYITNDKSSNHYELKQKINYKEKED